MGNLIKFDNSAHKRCDRCELVLPLTEFHKNRTKRLGVCEVCRKCKYQINKAYYSTPEGKLAVSGQTKRKWKRTREKINCRNTVNKAIQTKRLEFGPCEVCGTRELVEAHHEDYSKPFEINWLCKRHHMERHGKRLVKQENEYGAH